MPTFLTPAFLLGALAVAIPIYIHLTHREKKDVVDFPSLMFLRRIPYRSVRRQKLRHLFLFALRCLAILLIAVAFARPFFEQPSAAAASPLGPREVVFLIDNSYSMGYQDRFSAAKAELIARIGSLGVEDRGSIVVFSDRAEILSEPTSDQAALEALVSGIGLSARPTRFGPGLKLAKKIVEESELPRREVVLVSDFQRVGFSGEDDEVWLPAETRLTPVDLSSKATENLSVTGVVLDRNDQGGRERLTVSARVAYKASLAAGAPEVTEAKTSRIGVEIDGRTLQTKPIELAPNSSATVVFEPLTVPAGLSQGTVWVDDDALVQDNRYHFVLSAAQSLAVLILESGASPSRRSFYVEKALEIGDRPSFRVDARSLGALSPADLERAEAVLLNDVSKVSDAQARLFEAFLARGGGLVIAVGEKSSKESYAGAAARLLPAPLGAAVDRSRDWGGTLSYLDYANPVFEIFGAPHSGDFSSAKFFRYRAFDAPVSEGVLARFDDGMPALIERSVGKGRILVWTSTLDTFWNDLARQAVFLPFVHQVFKRSASYAEASAWQTVGEVSDLDRYLEMILESEGGDASERSRDLVVSSPSGVKTVVPRSQEKALLPLEEQGFYEVREVSGGAASAVSLAVNLDTTESDLSRLDPEELVASVTLREMGLASAPAPGGDTRDAQEGRQRHWWFLLIGAFVLFLGETLLSNRLSLKAR
jgi:hypothetical protein